MRRAALLLLLISAGTTAGFAQHPAPGADPHENPQLDGAAPPSSAPVTDPQAAPNPVPVRPPNLNAPAARNRSTPARPLSDAEIMSKIRTSLRADKATARDARNVRVIAHAGTVTLKGAVDSAETRHAIERKATEIAGEGKVTNEIDVKPAASGQVKRK